MRTDPLEPRGCATRASDVVESVTCDVFQQPRGWWYVMRVAAVLHPHRPPSLSPKNVKHLVSLVCQKRSKNVKILNPFGTFAAPKQRHRRRHAISTPPARVEDVIHAWRARAVTPPEKPDSDNVVVFLTSSRCCDDWAKVVGKVGGVWGGRGYVPLANFARFHFARQNGEGVGAFRP